jgi:Rps23 Pro-64 3,4-dihydroxylase Tpa1-like proline 4-hydroxylase
MIKKHDNILNKKLIKNIIDYLEIILKDNVWSSSIGWDQNLCLTSSNILTHRISDKFLYEEIKNNIEKALKINFEKENLDFICFLYIWSGGSYITWHSDSSYPYNGTIYLNEEWNSNDGGIFLYKDNPTNEIIGIEPIYNSMITNFETKLNKHNQHCVTCIVPGTIKKRITIQWRTTPKKKNILTYQ